MSRRLNLSLPAAAQSVVASAVQSSVPAITGMVRERVERAIMDEAASVAEGWTDKELADIIDFNAELGPMWAFIALAKAEVVRRAMKREGRL